MQEEVSTKIDRLQRRPLCNAVFHCIHRPLHTGNDKSAGLLDTTGLCLTDVEILPHYHRFLPRFEHFEEAHTGL